MIRGGSRTAAISKMERFVIIVNGWKPLTIITKRSILDVATVLDPPLMIIPKYGLRIIIGQRWNGVENVVISHLIYRSPQFGDILISSQILKNKLPRSFQIFFPLLSVLLFFWLCLPISCLPHCNIISVGFGCDYH